jgi:oligopeptide/dipeptide ABC transporter ATP-binding protein
MASPHRLGRERPDVDVEPATETTPDRRREGMPSKRDEILLDVQNLCVDFDTASGSFRAVDDVSFSVRRGQILGVVGESGSGKSVTAQAIMKLIPTPPGRYAGGRVVFDGRELLAMSERDLRRLRGDRIAMIFQNPRAALNPAFTVGAQLIEALREHTGLSRRDTRARAETTMRGVGFSDARRVLGSYPHQLSGGMCQRVGIAIAMATDPDLLIADEPTTALDVLVQKAALETLRGLHASREMPIILISHDFGVIRAMATQVLVMYAGQVQEQGAVDAILSRPGHPYTKGLLNSIPDPARKAQRLYQIDGHPPDLARLPPGCRFADRCEHVYARCRSESPRLWPTPSGSYARCHLQDPNPTAAAS